MTAQNLNVYQRLLKVQEQGKAPRTIEGKFGKSRSAEMILEAYKPVCTANGLYLYTSDVVVQVGGRNYITSTAIVVNVDDPTEQVSASASAWEGEVPMNKYGSEIIDTSQLSGKTSSYAKKYSIQNLFAIDDTKDADQDDEETQYNSKPTPVVQDRELAQAKTTINAKLIEQGYTTKFAKTTFIKKVLEKESIDNMEDANSVMDALENEA